MIFELQWIAHACWICQESFNVLLFFVINRTRVAVFPIHLRFFSPSPLFSTLNPQPIFSNIYQGRRDTISFIKQPGEKWLVPQFHKISVSAWLYWITEYSYSSSTARVNKDSLAHRFIFYPFDIFARAEEIFISDTLANIKC